MAVLSVIRGWFGLGPLAATTGAQLTQPSIALVEDVPNVGLDGALQVGAVWACIDRRASTIASLPFFAYNVAADGQKTLARNSRLYALLHDSPNSRMTAFEFWRAMMLYHDARGNAYARIVRDPATGEALAMWPMPADQVAPHLFENGTLVYLYQVGGETYGLAEANVLHLKGLGNGTTGLAKLDFMRATTDEMAKAQRDASKIFGTGGKPTGVLMIDRTLTTDQRAALRANFSEIQEGSASRLMVLEANMKYQQLSLSPQDQQLLESRKFGIEEICRWFDVPPILVHHSGATTWGSGIEQIVDGFYKLAIRPMLANIEQAVYKRLLTPAQRARMDVEFNLDAFLRGNPLQRSQFYATMEQNANMTSNECRQLENLPPLPGGDVLRVQSNMVPLDMLGKVKPSGGNSDAPQKDPVAQ